MSTQLFWIGNIKHYNAPLVYGRLNLLTKRDVRPRLFRKNHSDDKWQKV